jgi:arabinose-5-phosphate isomerase
MTIKDEIVHELALEAQAILRLQNQLEAGDLEQAFAYLCECTGKVVLTGVGKTGIIARKISATLASTGTTSIFLHAAEGIHGDLGMLQSNDVIVAISHSGQSAELIAIIPFIKFIGIPLIAITGNISSPLAEAADAVLDCSVPDGFDALGLIPTASTTAALALGDALAVTLLKHRNFSLYDFARFHPGGSIGKKLLLKVQDLMHSGEALPIVRSDASMSDAILEMTSKKLGCTAVMDENGLLVGIITDGDLRRQLQIRNSSFLNLRADECMTAQPKTAHPSDLAAATLNLMEQHQITMLPVVDESNHPVGMLHMHDLIRAGVV